MVNRSQEWVDSRRRQVWATSLARRRHVNNGLRPWPTITSRDRLRPWPIVTLSTVPKTRRHVRGKIEQCIHVDTERQRERAKPGTRQRVVPRVCVGIRTFSRQDLRDQGKQGTLANARGARFQSYGTYTKAKKKVSNYHRNQLNYKEKNRDAPPPRMESGTTEGYSKGRVTASVTIGFPTLKDLEGIIFRCI